VCLTRVANTMKQEKQYLLTFLVVIGFLRGDVFAGDGCPTGDFNSYLNCKVATVAKARINQRRATNQTETPSISSNSTSLVDQSSPADLVGVAANLAGLTTNSKETKTTSTSVTATLYSIAAVASGVNPLNPTFYFQNAKWRKVSFTLGYEYPDDDLGKAQDRATLAGFKILVFDRRDANHPVHAEGWKTVTGALGAKARNFNKVTRLVRNKIYQVVAPRLTLPERPTADAISRVFDGDQFANSLAILGDADLRDIDKIIEDNINAEVELVTEMGKLVKDIRRAPQFSFAFQSKSRKGGGPDEYRGEAILDYGLHDRLNLSVNAEFSYLNRSAVGTDSRGGRAAAEFQVRLTEESKESARKPIMLSFAGDGKWMTQMTPTYKGQVKLSIPVASGIDLPVSFSYASRTDLIKESDVRGKFGFTFDFAKLAKGLSH